MTKKHIEKLLEYLVIKEKVMNERLSLMPYEDKKTTNAVYMGMLEEWYAYACILDLMKDEDLLDKKLAIWKE